MSLNQVVQSGSPFDLPDNEIDWTLVRAEYASVVKAMPSDDDKEPALEFESVINENSEVAELRLKGARAYAWRLDARPSTSPTGHAFLNGKHFPVDDVSIS